mmetsp:Transcript_9635/g.22131  ORF Transcript_9635/g.22131 Transcript_9635/m.22131 type:complete len:225 (-) Transcript_9635:1010-1684(-)
MPSLTRVISSRDLVRSSSRASATASSTSPSSSCDTASSTALWKFASSSSCCLSLSSSRRFSMSASRISRTSSWTTGSICSRSSASTDGRIFSASCVRTRSACSFIWDLYLASRFRATASSCSWWALLSSSTSSEDAPGVASCWMDWSCRNSIRASWSMRREASYSCSSELLFSVSSSTWRCSSSALMFDSWSLVGDESVRATSGGLTPGSSSSSAAILRPKAAT